MTQRKPCADPGGCETPERCAVLQPELCAILRQRQLEPRGVAKLVPKREQGKQQLLDIIDSLRQAVESGQVVAFAAVGIEPDDCTRQWSGCTQGLTNLRIVGAVARLLHGVNTDTDEA